MSPDTFNRYALLKNPGELALCEERLNPELPGDEYIRLKVDYCGICGTDVDLFRGHSRAAYPRTLGHEYSGLILKTGNNVEGFQIGDTVAVDPNFRCGECQYCLAGKSNHCISSGVNLFSPRGFAYYVDIHYSYLCKIPNYSPEYLSCLAEPLSVALYAVDIAKVTQSDKVLILGCGGIGTMILFSMHSLFPQVECEIYDINNSKAERLASILPVNLHPADNPPNKAKYSLIFEATGQAEAFQTAASCLEKGGRVVTISRYHDQIVSIPPDFPYKEGSIRFVHLNGDGKAFSQAVNLIATGWREDFNRLLKIESFTSLPLIFKNLDKSTYNKTIIKIDEEFHDATNIDD